MDGDLIPANNVCMRFATSCHLVGVAKLGLLCAKSQHFFQCTFWDRRETIEKHAKTRLRLDLPSRSVKKTGLQSPNNFGLWEWPQ